ncbi:PA2169 family four-helix-bundle protein [Brevundimonas variabilis]|uniref:Uncharacterized protein (TIGR02284 family) n=1 Tax=Brevundimonas variabilis TaxID=74312 RepID=A0A7W9CK86_9CAUL|nr:PA2169 family four-helix-bundle protein [Brevundimonas variabilis]MBB5747225.1 uncharacterized protein (TIGR02284 family) [Brevundimonas variabilis]
MAIDNRHDIKLLNGLYSALLDNATTYGEAAEATPDAGHADFYRTREAHRRGLAAGLATEIEARGGEATHGEGLVATARKVVKDVKVALGRDEAAALSAIEQDETALLARFDRALDDAAMSATTRETIRRARGEVARGKP